jgi:hypothetical protein
MSVRKQNFRYFTNQTINDFTPNLIHSNIITNNHFDIDSLFYPYLRVSE